MIETDKDINKCSIITKANIPLRNQNTSRMIIYPKDIINRVKRQPTERVKFADHVSDNE